MKSQQKGDTIVEVMFAIAVFAFVAAGSLAVMRQGISTSMRSLEITQARQTMNDQATLLRFIQQDVLANPSSAYAGVWAKITSGTYDQMTPTTLSVCDPGSSVKKFVLNPSMMDTADSNKIITDPTLGTTDASLPAYPQFVGNTPYDFWVEAVHGVSQGVKFVDFNIRACWSAPGSDAPVTLGTIVRLYEK